MTALPHDGRYHQRWMNRRHGWAADTSFDRHKYEVARIDEGTARAFVGQHHYAHSMPGEIRSFGLYERGFGLVGVLALTSPMNVAVLRTPFPALEPYAESAELGRLVQLPRVPPPGESFFSMEALHQAARMGFRGIVTHADPVARYTAAGECIKPGHFGTTYQACSALPAGHTRPRWQYVLPDHTLLNERSGQKVAGGERNAGIAEDQLVRAGAQPMRAGEDPRAWLRAARDSLCVRQWHPGNYRYLIVLGSKSERRALRRDIPLARLLGVPAITLPLHAYYPKAEDYRVQ
jgi:hypothetical protein